jgi:ABC-type lipoprotein export system ATPase subunit/ABC-type lipoprotein release transport system permease subunit
VTASNAALIRRTAQTQTKDESMAELRPSLARTALLNLRRKPFRTISLVVSIGLLTALLIFALSSSVRMNLGINRTMQQMGGDIMVVPVGAVSDPDDFLFGSQRISLRMSRDVLDTLRDMVGVSRAASHTYLTTLPGLCCGVSEGRIIAYDPKEDFVVVPWMQKSLERELRPGEVVMGGEIQMGFELFETEGQAWVLGKKFTVAGQLEKTGTPLDNTIFIREDDVRDVIDKGLTGLQVKADEVSVVFLELDKGFDIDTIAKTIEREFLQVKAISRGKINARLKNFFEATSRIFAFTVLMGALLALLVVGSVFSAVANERRREVGMIRALGATKKHVLRLFVFEAFFTGLIGSVLGLFLGSAFGMIMNRSIDTVTKFPITFTVGQTALIDGIGMAAGIIICIIGALYPVSRINRFDPLDAIKEADVVSPAVVPAAGAEESDRGDAIVTTSKIVKSYFDGDVSISAVESVDFEIGRGEFVTILGHSGSGKTTLLSMIGGLTKPNSGSVSLDGTNLAVLDDAELASLRNRKIGFIFQFASLIPTLTSVENVLFPLAFSSDEGASREKAEELLRLVGLEDKFDAYPSQLSGGQQRRVAIARAFIMDPDIILADEPTGDLDVDTEAEVMKLFRDMHQAGMTFAMVTHEREITRFADRVVEMKKGEIV